MLHITMIHETAQYTVKNGLIHYVELSKPCAISNPHDPFGHIDITPYEDQRELVWGVFEMDTNGYSATPHSIRKVILEHSEYAKKRYVVWCEQFGCNLSWEEAKKLAGWC